ncbi:hypothetical protein VTJ49DRAFT_1194 [Mycothermus thermophilus]|uniref:Uncharacterized protein n=1 Tax=Humicola insolens TaxID=85995 RepID=A0ABR3VED2_HUMIN
MSFVAEKIAGKVAAANEQPAPTNEEHNTVMNTNNATADEDVDSLFGDISDLVTDDAIEEGESSVAVAATPAGPSAGPSSAGTITPVPTTKEANPAALLTLPSLPAAAAGPATSANVAKSAAVVPSSPPPPPSPLNLINVPLSGPPGPDRHLGVRSNPVPAKPATPLADALRAAFWEWQEKDKRALAKYQEAYKAWYKVKVAIEKKEKGKGSGAVPESAVKTLEKKRAAAVAAQVAWAEQNKVFAEWKAANPGVELIEANAVADTGRVQVAAREKKERADLVDELGGYTQSHNNSQLRAHDEMLRLTAESRAREMWRQRVEMLAKVEAMITGQQRLIEDARRQAEMEQQNRLATIAAEEEGRKKALEEARKKAELEAALEAQEEERKKAEEHARRKAKAEARKKAKAEEERKKAEEAKKIAEARKEELAKANNEVEAHPNYFAAASREYKQTFGLDNDSENVGQLEQQLLEALQNDGHQPQQQTLIAAQNDGDPMDIDGPSYMGVGLPQQNATHQGDSHDDIRRINQVGFPIVSFDGQNDTAVPQPSSNAPPQQLAQGASESAMRLQQFMSEAREEIAANPPQNAQPVMMPQGPALSEEGISRFNFPMMTLAEANHPGAQPSAIPGIIPSQPGTTNQAPATQPGNVAPPAENARPIKKPRSRKKKATKATGTPSDQAMSSPATQSTPPQFPVPTQGFAQGTTADPFTSSPASQGSPTSNSGQAMFIGGGAPATNQSHGFAVPQVPQGGHPNNYGQPIFGHILPGTAQAQGFETPTPHQRAAGPNSAFPATGSSGKSPTDKLTGLFLPKTQSPAGPSTGQCDFPSLPPSTNASGSKSHKRKASTPAAGTQKPAKRRQSTTQRRQSIAQQPVGQQGIVAEGNANDDCVITAVVPRAGPAGKTPPQVPVDPALHFNISPPSEGRPVIATAIKAGAMEAINHLLEQGRKDGTMLGLTLFEGPGFDYSKDVQTESLVGSVIDKVLNDSKPVDNRQAYNSGAFQLLRKVLEEATEQSTVFGHSFLVDELNKEDKANAKRAMSEVYRKVSNKYTSPSRSDVENTGTISSTIQAQQTPTTMPDIPAPPRKKPSGARKNSSATKASGVQSPANTTTAATPVAQSVPSDAANSQLDPRFSALMASNSNELPSLDQTMASSTPTGRRRKSKTQQAMSTTPATQPVMNANRWVRPAYQLPPQPLQPVGTTTAPAAGGTTMNVQQQVVSATASPDPNAPGQNQVDIHAVFVISRQDAFANNPKQMLPSGSMNSTPEQLQSQNNGPDNSQLGSGPGAAKGNKKAATKNKPPAARKSTKASTTGNQASGSQERDMRVGGVPWRGPPETGVNVSLSGRGGPVTLSAKKEGNPPMKIGYHFEDKCFHLYTVDPDGALRWGGALVIDEELNPGAALYRVHRDHFLEEVAREFGLDEDQIPKAFVLKLWESVDWNIQALREFAQAAHDYPQE